MTAYIVTEMAVSQAIGLCFLARQSGLPDIHSLRVAVVQLHDGPCGWCYYPPKELLRMLDERQVSEYAEKSWWGMPGKARLRAIAVAAGREDVP